MEQLTKEYFDKGLGNLLENMATKDDLKDLATKDDLKTQTVELKHYVRESFEIQQVWMDERFKELIVKYDVRERVEKLEKEVAQLRLNRPAHA